MPSLGVQSLADKVAIVTGSGGVGSGRAIAERLARDGAAVVVNDVSEAGAAETARRIQAAVGRGAWLRGDVGREDDVRRLVAFAEETFGGLDLLVNNASHPYPGQGLLSGWFEAVRVDLLGTLYATWHAIPAMRRRGGGAILNIGSTSALGHGHKPSASPGYDVAKAGVQRLATMLAPLADEANVRVNCLLPDWVATPEVQEYFDALTPDQRAAQGVPPVLTSLDELSDAVFELLTDDKLAGRIMVWWSGQPKRFLKQGDPGHAGWEGE